MSATELLRLVPDAPAAVGRILDPARGPLERPNRSEIFGPERFAQHGRSLGDTHAARFARRGSIQAGVRRRTGYCYNDERQKNEAQSTRPDEVALSVKDGQV